jgi:hypothetical protein
MQDHDKIWFEINLMTEEFNRIMSNLPKIPMWGEEGKDFEVISSTLHTDKNKTKTNDICLRLK